MSPSRLAAVHVPQHAAACKSQAAWMWQKHARSWSAPALCAVVAMTHYRVYNTTACSPHTQDHTGQQWLTAFEESGVKIIGKTAHELKQLEGTAEFERIIQVCTFACVLWSAVIRVYSVRKLLVNCQPMVISKHQRG